MDTSYVGSELLEIVNSMIEIISETLKENPPSTTFVFAFDGTQVTLMLRSLEILGKLIKKDLEKENKTADPK